MRVGDGDHRLVRRVAAKKDAVVNAGAGNEAAEAGADHILRRGLVGHTEAWHDVVLIGSGVRAVATQQEVVQTAVDGGNAAFAGIRERAARNVHTVEAARESAGQDITRRTVDNSRIGGVVQLGVEHRDVAPE